MPLPHRCGNAAHEMDGFRAGFQEHNHLSSRSCGPSAALCGLRVLTTPCNSAHWVSVERKNKVIWFNLLQFDSTPWPVVESQHLRLQWLQAIYWWSSRPVSCKDLQFAWALTEVSSNLPKKHCHRSSGLDSTKLHNAILYIYTYICTHMYRNKKHLQPVWINFSYLYSAQSIQCHQGLSAWLCGELPKSTRWTFMLGTVSVRSRPKRQAQKMHAESTLQWGGRSSFWQLGNECHPRLHPLQLAVWCCKIRNRRSPVTFIAPALYI